MKKTTRIVFYGGFMNLGKKDLESAAKAGLISTEQAKKVWDFWQKQHQDTPQFHFAHVLYYLGGLLAISAITLFVTRAWDTMVGMPLFLVSSLLFLIGVLLTHHFLGKKLRIPAGIMSTFSLALVPLAFYNIQIWFGFLPPTSDHYSDFHNWVNWYWVPMELATLFVGCILFYIYRFQFLLFPISIVLWYMSMDLYALLQHFNNDEVAYRAAFSMYFGLILLLATVFFDLKSSDDKQDYPFWLYIIGVIIFWVGLSCQESNSEVSKFIYCLINLAMVFVSVFLDRRVFAVFGAIGILGYIGHLSVKIFPDSLSFPIALVFLGILIILFGTTWTRVQKKLTTYFRPYIPKKILNRMR